MNISEYLYINIWNVAQNSIEFRALFLEIEEFSYGMLALYLVHGFISRWIFLESRTSWGSRVALFGPHRFAYLHLWHASLFLRAFRSSQRYLRKLLSTMRLAMSLKGSTLRYSSICHIRLYTHILFNFSLSYYLINQVI